MAVAYITEYAELPVMGGQPFGAAKEPSITTQTVAIGAAAASSAFNAATRYIRLHVDAIASYRFGTAPTAVVTDPRMAASQTEYFAVPVGAAYKVSIVSNT